MLEWLGIGALYVAALGGMTWWVLRRRTPRPDQADDLTAATDGAPSHALSQRLETAYQRARQALESEARKRSSDLLDDWTIKTQQAYDEGLRLLDRAAQLRRASQIKSDAAVVQQRIRQNLRYCDEMLQQAEQVIQALDLVALDATRFFQWDGRPTTQATDALQSAMAAAHRMEQRWSGYSDETKMHEDT